jgi:hypothetical protein
VALAAPVFPIGNVAEGAALLYAFFAIGWLVLSWRDARHGLLFVAGPLLATVGLLPIVPLVLQRAHGTWRRAAHGALAVLSTVLLAALAGSELPFTDAAVKSLGVEPLTPVAGAASDVWVWLAAHPVTSVAALLVAAASALLPWARRFSQFGVGAVGFVLVAASVFAGASVPSTLLALLIWGVAGFSDQLLRRAS